MIEDFLVRAVAGGIGVALAAGPLGCFVVWRRMAYFGEALSHSALLGVTLGLLLGIDLLAGIMATCVIVALFLAALERQRLIAMDTRLGILAHGSLALGILFVVTLLQTVPVDLVGYLFGDILAVGRRDLYVIYGTLAGTLLALAWLWRPLLALTVHEELAVAEGVRALPVRIAFMVLMALVIAIGMKVVGVLLIVALLIVPAAAARRIAGTPEEMALAAAAIGVVSVVLGIAGAFRFDAPAGPAIVIAAIAIFAALFAWPRPRSRASNPWR